MSLDLRRWQRRLRRWWRYFQEWVDDAAASAVRGTRRLGRKLLAWWRSRRFQLLLRSVPALAALTGMIVAAAAVYANRTEVPIVYKQQADQKLAGGNHVGSMICFQRLVYLQRPEPADLYGLAISLDNLGQKERAAAMMEQLAPADRLGYGPAHLWIAKYRAKNGIPLQSLDTHLRFAFVAHPDDREVNALLGRLYLDLNRPAEAERHLIVAAESSQEFRLFLARAYAIQGKRGLMEIEIQRIIERAKANVMSEPEVPLHRLIWADALMLRRDFSSAEAVLADGVLRPHAEKYRRPLAMLYVGWYMHLVRNEKNATVGDHLAVLERGLSVDPDCPEVIMALYTVMQSHKTESEKIRQTLLKELAAGKAVSSIHFVLGFDAMERGESKAAITHFEIAYQMEPGMAIAANNLAWLLATAKNPDLSRALATITPLVERFPNEPRFHATRGHILAMSGRHQEALVELLRALPVYGERPDLHERLAEVYSQLGLESSALVHRGLAKEKRGG